MSTVVGSVTIKDNRIKKLQGAMRKKGLEKAVMAGGQQLEAYAKINVNETFSSKATGGAGLAGSIQTVIETSSDQAAYAAVGPTVVYGRIQELGGEILPVHAKMLSWINDAGERIFAKRVVLPARPYLRPAYDEHKTEIVQVMKDTLRRIIDEALG
jgi:phage gpG-like protein